MRTVYSLSCPIDGLVKYIGLTTEKLETRLNHHLKSPTNGANYIWFSLLSKYNYKPIIEFVDECEDNKYIALKLEQFWIQQFRCWGFDLNNNKRIPIENDIIIAVNNLIKETGLKKHFIAKNINVSPITFCHAINGKRNNENYTDILLRAELFLLTKKNKHVRQPI